MTEILTCDKWVSRQHERVEETFSVQEEALDSPDSETTQMNFWSPKWQAYLESLVQYCSQGFPLVMLNGELGSGRSVMLNQLYTQLSRRSNAHLVKASLAFDLRELVIEFADGFQLDVAISNTDLKKALKDQFEILKHREEHCYLLVDNANKLSRDVLEGIVKLVKLQDAKVYLTIVLVADKGFREMFVNLLLEEEIERNVPTVQLAPLNFTETTAYLEQYRGETDALKNLELTDRIVSHIYNLSGGLPGRINHVARQVALLPPAPVAEKKESGFARHRIKIFSTLLLVGLAAWGYFSQYRVTRDLRPPVIIKNTHHHEVKMLAPKKASQVLKPSAMAVVISPPSVPAPSVHLIPMPDFTFHDAIYPQSSATLAQPTVNKVSSVPSKTVYTLQLVGALHPEKTRAMLKTLHLQARVMMGTFHHQPWYTFLYGHFASISDAKKALKALPPEVKKLHPWVRTLQAPAVKQ